MNSPAIPKMTKRQHVAKFDAAILKAFRELQAGHKCTVEDALKTAGARWNQLVFVAYRDRDLNEFLRGCRTRLITKSVVGRK